MSASKQQTPKHGSGHRHPPELRERAVRMVEETIKQTGERHGVVTRVAVQLGLGSETLRHWVKQAEVDNGQRPGITTQDQQRIAELEKENRELRRANRARAQGGILNPRLLLALDEAANFARIPRLAGYTSSGPGQGIQLLLCYHDLAQVESGYGAEAARTIWNNCRVRVLLPGQGDLKTLEQFSRAIGDETRVFHTQHTDRWRSSSGEQRVGRPLATIDELRRQHHAVLLYANAPPAQLELRRWDQVPAWRQLVSPRPAVGAGIAGKGDR